MLVLSATGGVRYELNISRKVPLLVFSFNTELKGPKNTLDNWTEAKEHAPVNTNTAAQKDGSLSLMLHTFPWLNFKISSKALSPCPAILSFHELESKQHRKITSFEGQQLILGESEPSFAAG